VRGLFFCLKEGRQVRKLITIIAAAGLVLSGAVAANATPDTTTVWWLVPEGAELEPSDHPQGDGWRVGSDGFPQTLLPGGANDLECGDLAQVDIYPVDAAAEITADGILYEGEDYDAIISWRFVYGGDCNIVPDVPEVEVPAKLTAPKAPVEIQTAVK